MKRIEYAIRTLIKGGYDETLARTLFGLHVEDFLDADYNKLCEKLNDFIDKVQTGEIKPEGNTKSVLFAYVSKMREDELSLEASSGMLYDFLSEVNEGFKKVIGRYPLVKILESGGAVVDVDGEKKYSKPINVQGFADLCEVDGLYIRERDLYNLFRDKGIDVDSVSMVQDEEESYDDAVYEGIYISHRAIMNVGESSLGKQMVLNPNGASYPKVCPDCR